MKKNKVFGALSIWSLAALVATKVAAASLNGSAGEMPAYYDDQLFTINFFELPPGGEVANDQHNTSINIIYMSDAGLPGGEPFISVIDAIQTDGFNPLWFEVQIVFAPNVMPRQLFSDDEIMDAERAGEISLVGTGEVYRCSVIGPLTSTTTASTD